MQSEKVKNEKVPQKEKFPKLKYSFDFIDERLKKRNLESLKCDLLTKFCGKLQLKTTRLY